MMDHFLQSPEWREVLREQGTPSVFIGLDEHQHEIYGFIKKMRGGIRQLYIPRAQLTNVLHEKVLNIAQKEQVDLVRYEPLAPHAIPSTFVKVGDYQPSHTLIIDLTQPLDVLYNELHHKTRYNISLAKKKGVTVRIGNLDEFDIFWKLISSTYQRKGISTLSYDHYMSIIRNHPGSYLTFAEFEGVCIAANIYIRYGTTVTYVHGGSDTTYRHLMAPHLLQWSEIERSKLDGFAYYDMWGVAPDDAPNHPWAGISRFKRGFGGTDHIFPGTYELGLTWKYKLYNFVRKLR